MKVILKHNGRTVVKHTTSISVSNNAPYSVQFKVLGKSYERFTLCADYHQVLQNLVSDIIDLRDWYCIKDKCSPSNADVVKLFYDISAVAKSNLPDELLKYKRIIKCIENECNVFNHFPSKLLEDLYFEIT